MEIPDSSLRDPDRFLPPDPLTSPQGLLLSLRSERGDNWLVTGGAGFLGSNFVLSCRWDSRARIFNLDKLTAAGNLANLEELGHDQDHLFIRGDIRNRILVQRILHEYMPSAVIHFAAECQASSSVDNPDIFVQTNVLGTFSILDEVRQYWEGMDHVKRSRFRFLHLTRGDVYGYAGPENAPHTESSAYAPFHPCAATKASSDFLVRSYFHTYGLPTLIANCTESYGPRQFPDQPVPSVILGILDGCGGTEKSSIPITNRLYVEDQCRALRMILERGKPGETYHVGGEAATCEAEVADITRSIMDELHRYPAYSRGPRSVEPSPEFSGARRRCVLDISRLRNELGWKPRESFESGMRKTVRWYLENMNWVNEVRSGAYRSRVRISSMEC